MGARFNQVGDDVKGSMSGRKKAGAQPGWSLFRRSIVGSYHKVSAKHLDAYLDEFEWRFNTRKNPFLFRDTVLKLIASSSLEYKKTYGQGKVRRLERN
jgi:hypothetical protein